jgi:peptidoglycan/LPS O-acetylase OafA/YrhL
MKCADQCGDRLNGQLSISKAYSVYLDLFRVIAAIVVVGGHAMMPAFSGGHYLFPFGEDAVEAFFVLSGFVIASVADGRESSFQTFAVARLSRLWSVLIPALFIGPALVHWAVHIWHLGFMGQFQGPELTSEFVDSFAAAFFVNELWFLSLTPQFNTPLWSICFEFWYYTIFAIYMFAPRRWKWMGVAVAAFIAGPEILLLIPGWILGAVLYHLRSRIHMSRQIAWAVFFAAPALVIVGHVLHIAPLLQGLYVPLLGEHFIYGEIFFARDFLWQNLVGLALAAHLAAACVLFRGVDAVPAIPSATIRWAAGLTYAIYLLHFPAAFVLISLLHAMPDGPLKVVVVLVGATIVSAAFGMLLEPLKGPLRKLMTRLVTPYLKEPATFSAS